MSPAIPRLRMFAGPNGSGKSTLKSYLPTDLLGVYLNPDEIDQGIRDRGFLDFAQYGVVANGTEVFQFFRDSDFLAKAGLTSAFRMPCGRPPVRRTEPLVCLAPFEKTAGSCRLDP